MISVLNNSPYNQHGSSNILIILPTNCIGFCYISNVYVPAIHMLKSNPGVVVFEDEAFGK